MNDQIKEAAGNPEQVINKRLLKAMEDAKSDVIKAVKKLGRDIQPAYLIGHDAGFFKGAEYALSEKEAKDIDVPQSEPYGYIFEGTFFTKKHLPPEWTYTSDEKPLPVYLRPEKEEEWIPVENRDNPMPPDDDILILFDTGDVRLYSSEDWPFGIVTHWRRTNLPKSK